MDAEGFLLPFPPFPLKLNRSRTNRSLRRREGFRSSTICSLRRREGFVVVRFALYVVEKVS